MVDVREVLKSILNRMNGGQIVTLRDDEAITSAASWGTPSTRIIRYDKTAGTVDIIYQMITKQKLSNGTAYAIGRVATGYAPTAATPISHFESDKQSSTVRAIIWSETHEDYARMIYIVPTGDIPANAALYFHAHYYRPGGGLRKPHILPFKGVEACLA